MVDSEIALRVQQLGAEGVRSRLREINDELHHGAPVTRELKNEVRELSTQVNTQERVVRLSSRAWLESHQTLQTTARVMSAVGSVARSVLAITTAFSVATLAFGKGSADLVEAEGDLGRANRELAAALQSGDPEKIAQAQENVNKFTARVKELKDQKTQEQATSILNLVASIALIASSGATAAAKLGPLVSKVLPALGSIMAGITSIAPAVLIAVGAIAAAVAAVALAFYMILTPGDQVEEFLTHFFPDQKKQIHDFNVYLDDVFGVQIPNAFIFMANTALRVFNSVVGFAESMVNGVINGINAIISAVNRVAAVLHLPQLSLIGNVSFASIKASEIPYLQSSLGGGGQSRGSGAGDTTPFAQVTRASGIAGGNGQNVTINIKADTITDAQIIQQVRNAIKGNLRDLGYTGH